MIRACWSPGGKQVDSIRIPEPHTQHSFVSRTRSRGREAEIVSTVYDDFVLRTGARQSRTCGATVVIRRARCSRYFNEAGARTRARGISTCVAPAADAR